MQNYVDDELEVAINLLKIKMKQPYVKDFEKIMPIVRLLIIQAKRDNPTAVE